MVMSNSGFNGTVTETEYSFMWALGGEDGFESAAAWKASQGSGRQVSVAAQSGRAFSKGVISKETVALTAALSTPTNGGFFLVCRRIDWTGKTSSIVVLTGPTTNTTAPTQSPADYSGVTGRNTSPGVLFDQPIAWAWARSTDTTVVLFDLRRVAGTPADLAELATWGGPEGSVKTIAEGGGQFARSRGAWVQRTAGVFANQAAADTAFGKASGAFLVQGASAWLQDIGEEVRYFAAYNAVSNPNGRKTPGWYRQRHPMAFSGSAAGVTVDAAASYATLDWSGFVDFRVEATITTTNAATTLLAFASGFLPTAVVHDYAGIQTLGGTSSAGFARIDAAGNLVGNAGAGAGFTRAHITGRFKTDQTR